MPISDNYVVQYLVQNTTSGRESLVWRETEAEGYVTSINGIDVEFGSVPSRTGSRAYVIFSAPAGSIQIVEPHNIGFFHPKYANEDEERLVQLMKDLGHAIRDHCFARRKLEAQSSGIIRESLYRRVLGVQVSELEHHESLMKP